MDVRGAPRPGLAVNDLSEIPTARDACPALAQTSSTACVFHARAQRCLIDRIGSDQDEV